MVKYFLKKLLISFSFLLFSFFAISQNYKPVDAGSKVHFVIKNFGISTGGDLHGLSGNINLVPSNISASSFDVAVNVNTIDTDNENRDTHLKSPEYFNAEKYPLITLKSTKINKTNKSNTGLYQFTGTLTIHGISKSIVFLFTAMPNGTDYLFAGNFTINRLDFGVGKNSSVLSNTVKVSLSVLAKKS